MSGYLMAAVVDGEARWPHAPEPNPNSDERTKRLEQVAMELMSRVREDDPEANGRWLAAVLPDPNDWFALAFVLAAAVPTDRTWRQLTAWTRFRRAS